VPKDVLNLIKWKDPAK